MKRWTRFVLLLLLGACSGDDGGNNGAHSGGTDNPWGITASGPGVLSVSPLDPATLVTATPLGKLAPPGHVLPTDHVYLSYVDPWSGQQQNNDCSKRPIYAAGGGVVMFVMQTETAGDLKVMIQMTRTFYYYYDHVLLEPGIAVGSRVNAGDRIGTTTGRCPSIDLGVIDLEVNPPGLVKPSRYGDFGAHAASPYKYFTPELQTLYYSKVRLPEGVPADKDGRIDWGVAGTLAGDWFHESLANAPASTVMGPDGWGKTLAFAYDWYDGTPRISIGGLIATPGVLAIGNGDPDPKTVTPASGPVVYRTTRKLGLIADGHLLVAMSGPERIRVEYFPATAIASAPPTTFTAAAKEYVR